jgi:hypothetical protein
LCSYSSTDHPNDFTFKVVPHITNAIHEWIERVAMIPVDGMEGPTDVCDRIGGHYRWHEITIPFLLFWVDNSGHFISSFPVIDCILNTCR